MANALTTFARRLNRAMRVLRTGDIEQKQFAFIWRDTEAQQTQWHLVDYETYAKEGYSMNALAHMAIKYKTDSFAQVPLRAYEGNVDNPIPLPPDNPLQMLVTHPNHYQSWYEFIQLCDTYYNLDGNCFIYMQPSTEGDLPEGLYPLRPDRVFIKPFTNKGKGDVGYLYVQDGMSINEGIPILKQDMMHIKTPNPLDPLEGMGYGLAPLMPVARDVDQDNMMTQFLFNIFSHQGVMPGGFIEAPFKMDEDDMAVLRQQFLESEGGSANWGKPIVLDEDAKYRPGSFTLDQLDVSMIDARQIKRILGVFGVPARLLELTDESSTFSNVQEARKEFWTRTMRSEIKVFEDEFKFRLQSENTDWFVQFDIGDVPALQQNLTDAVTIFATLVQNGIPINEAAARVKLNLPLVAGGDIPYISANLIPLGTMQVQDIPQLESGVQESETEEDDNTFEDVDNEDETASVPTGTISKNISRWDYENKQLVWKDLDEVTVSFEPEFARLATKEFRHDQDVIIGIINDAKATINWRKARRNINLYLSTAGATSWRSAFAPAIIGLNDAQTERWMKIAPDRFPSTFSLRNVQAESWFNRYLLNFATSVNDTTRNDIHRIISDGLESGISNDRIADSIEQLFNQYIAGGVDPETFAFLEDRMPAHRRELIARTETHGAMSAGNHELFVSAGIQKKEWLATGDGRTRDTHMTAWNRYSEGGRPGPILMAQSFSVGGSRMQHPGDKSAPIKEWANCRCVELPFLE